MFIPARPGHRRAVSGRRTGAGTIRSGHYCLGTGRIRYSPLPFSSAATRAYLRHSTQARRFHLLLARPFLSPGRHCLIGIRRHRTACPAPPAAPGTCLGRAVRPGITGPGIHWASPAWPGRRARAGPGNTRHTAARPPLRHNSLALWRSRIARRPATPRSPRPLPPAIHSRLSTIAGFNSPLACILHIYPASSSSFAPATSRLSGRSIPPFHSGRIRRSGRASICVPFAATNYAFQIRRSTGLSASIGIRVNWPGYSLGLARASLIVSRRMAYSSSQVIP